MQNRSKLFDYELDIYFVTLWNCPIFVQAFKMLFLKKLNLK